MVEPRPEISSQNGNGKPEEQYSRRELIQRAVAVGIGAPAALALAALDPETVAAGVNGPGARINAAFQNESEQDGVDYAEGVRGGVLRVALPADIPTLDITTTSNVFPAQVVWAVCEPLFTYDAGFRPVPMLAESIATSDDHLTHTITLRQGVNFHDGGQMTADDVVASLQRWLEISAPGQRVNARLDELVQIDDYVIEFRLNAPYGALLDELSIGSRGCPIYPRAFVEEAGDEAVASPIGTGPYRFVEWLPDRFIRLERFDDYSALPGEPDGYGGHKFAFVDEIIYTPVPDEAARLAGLQAGDYDYLTELDPVHFSTLQNDPQVTVGTLPVPFTKFNLIMNMRTPAMSQLELRQAFQAAIACEPIMVASVGEGFYRLDPSLMMRETPWHSEVGSELFNRNDPEAARQLLEASSYDGETLRLITSVRHETRAIVVKDQLEAIGVNIDLQIVEQTTFNQITQTTDDWELTVGGFTFVPDPSKTAMIQMCPFLGHWCDAESEELALKAVTEPSFEERFAAWEQYQRNYYDQAPYVMLGDWVVIQARSAKVEGQILQTALGSTFWNMWLQP